MQLPKRTVANRNAINAVLVVFVCRLVEHLANGRAFSAFWGCLSLRAFRSGDDQEFYRFFGIY